MENWWHEGCNMVLKRYNNMALGRVFQVTINSLIYTNKSSRLAYTPCINFQCISRLQLQKCLNSDDLSGMLVNPSSKVSIIGQELLLQVVILVEHGSNVYIGQELLLQVVISGDLGRPQERA